MNKNQIIYAYNRQSTEDQNLENGRLVIYDYLNKNNYNTSNLDFYSEIISGYKYSYSDRLIGTKILPKIKEGDILIVTELSRISRKLVDVLKFIENEVVKKKFKLIIIKNNMTIDDNPLNKLIISVLAMCAEFEIDLLRSRTRDGIKRYRNEHNGQWGRRKGQKSKLKLYKYKDDILKMREIGVTQKKIAEKYKVSPLTISKFIKRYHIEQ